MNPRPSRRSLSGTNRLLGVAGLLLLGACSLDMGDPDASPGGAGGAGGAGGGGGTSLPEDPEARKDTPFGTRVLIGPPGNQIAVDFKPVEEPTAPPGAIPVYFPAQEDVLSDLQPAAYLAPPGLTWQNTEDGSTTKTTAPAAAISSAWMLVYAAAKECLGTSTEASSPNTGHPALGSIKPVVPSWAKDGEGRVAWAIFPEPPRNCEQLLAMEEALLCTADKLTELADTLAPIRWSKVGQDPPEGFPAGDWVIPPQKAEDQFVVRDLALHLLANLATTDPRKFKVDGQPSACADLFARASKDASFASTHSAVLFGAPIGAPPPYFPPAQPLSQETAASVAAGRLLLEAQILHAAGRLAAETFQKNALNIEAVARTTRARALDPVEGAQLAWGTASQKPAYNTFAHGLRTAGGRLEMGPGAPDRACQGTAALKLLTHGYGADLAAEIEDRPVLTQAQATALRLVESSGIVLSPEILNTTSHATLVEALGDQLVGLSAIEDGFSPQDPTYREGLGKTILATVQQVDEADLRFAFARTSQVYQRMTSEVADADLKATPLPPQNYSSDFVKGLQGITIKGGTPCGAAPASRRAQMLQAEAASACEEYRGAEGILNPDLAYSAPFQSSVALGQAIYRRLVVVRENARSVGLTGKGSAGAFAEVATAETRAWAGSARMMIEAPPGTSLGTLTVRLIGVEPSQFGVRTLEELKDQVSLAVGPAWVANCAAGLQVTCPENFQQAYTMKPSSLVVEKAPEDTSSTRVYGDGGVASMTFEAGNLKNPYTQYGENKTSETIYLVQNQAVNRSILGAARAIAGSAVAVEIFSPAKDSHHERMDRDPHPVTRPGDNCGGDPRDVCAPGISKDRYIPVQNDLTPGGDPGGDSSWRHYLNAARQAAEKTDQLGKEALQELLQIDLRREGAGEQLAAICGDYGSLADLEFSGGKVSSSKNKALQTCLDETKVDVVFFTNDPLDGDIPEQEKIKILRQTLQCDSSVEAGQSNPLCKKIDDGKYKDITHDGLNLTDYMGAPPKAELSECQDLFASLNNLAQGTSGTNRTRMLEASVKQWAAPQNWVNVIRSLGLVERLDKSWQLRYFGKPILDSSPGNLWPGCLASGQCNENAHIFHSIFFENSVYESTDKKCNPGDALSDTKCLKNQIVLGDQNFWTMQGILWTMAALAGEVPGNLFEVYVPVADLSKIKENVPIVAAYHAGHVAQMPPGQAGLFEVKDSEGAASYFLKTKNEIEQVRLGPSVISPQKRWVSTKAPEWLFTIGQSPSDNYKYLRTSNQRISPVEHPFRSIGGLQTLLNEALPQSNCSDGYEALSDKISIMKGMFYNTKAPQTDQIRNLNVQDGFTGISLQQTQHFLQAFQLCHIKDSPNIDAKYKANAVPYLIHNYSLQKHSFQAFNFVGQVNVYGVSDTSWVSHVVANGYQKDNPPKPNCLKGGENVSLGAYLPVNCFDESFQGNFEPGLYFYDSHPHLLAPSVCGPSKRVPALVNSGVASDCDAATQLIQAFALQCAMASSGSISASILSSGDPPEMTSLEDFPLLLAWIDRQSMEIDRQLSRLHVESLPERVLFDFSTGLVGSGTTQGEQGIAVLEIQKSLQDIFQGWLSISRNIQLLRDQIRLTSLRLRSLDLEKQSALESLALQNLQIQSRMVQAGIRGATGLASTIAGIVTLNAQSALSGGVQVASSAVEIYYAKEEQDIISKIGQLSKDKINNNLLQILAEMNSSVGTIYSDLNKSLSATRAATAQARIATKRLDSLSEQARYQAAKANAFGFFNGDPFSNSDYASLGGRDVSLPVNTVMRRQAQVANLRHQVALHEAKELACIARLSIEQKLGVRLSDIKEPIGPYAPAMWADDVGLMNGVDYNALRNSFSDIKDSNDSSKQASGDYKDLFNTGVDLLAGLSNAKQFVGDYVDRLENFVTLYNVRYPAQNGADTVVLSLANDILAPTSTCRKDSPNLLYFSGDLSKNLPQSDPEKPAGWFYGPCSALTCVQAIPGASLQPPLLGPVSGVEPQQATLLLPVSPVPIPGGDPPAPSPLSQTVWQQVRLNAGNYVASWWAQSRGNNGAPNPAQASSYRVLLLRKENETTFTTVASQQLGAHLATPQDAWGQRLALPFFVEESGDYLLAFQPLAEAESSSTLAIAAAQLEATNDFSVNPTAYSPTDATRELLTGVGCSLGPVDVRNAFERVCTPVSGCFYALQKPFSLRLTPLGAILDKKQALAGKFAIKNGNFRHGTLSLNLVGTAVHHCPKGSPSSCYGSLYENFSLAHLANPVPVLNAMGKSPDLFNFGSQRISNGKALAAERLLTLPLSSSDLGLLSQPGLELTELRGRPLDGDYVLLIQDSPSLQWNRLEDIQIVLRYHHASPTQLNPGSP